MTTPSTGQIRFNLKYHWLVFTFAMFTPKAVINGHEVPLKWGENTINAPAGVHQVMVYIAYLWKFGKATITVDNSDGSVPTVYYAAPVWTFAKGAIGQEPQKVPGLIGAYIMYGVFALAIILCCCGSALLNGTSN